MNARKYLEILHVAERLKDTPRHCTTTNGRTESVAEHSLRISLMAFLLRHEFKDLDIDKVVDMCLIHDLGECFTGDIPTFIKTDSDREVEDSLLNQWVKTLPRELSDDMAALYKEMDAQETKEAKLYKALDKLEALIQHNESPIDTWSENEYELNKTYAFDTVAFSEWLTDLRKAILDDTLEKIDSEGQNSGHQKVPDSIFLYEANEQYTDELQNFKDEILEADKDNGDQFAGCMGLRDCATAKEWIDICNLRKCEETCELAGTKVPSTTYFAIRESDHRLVGVIDLRHHINHPILGSWGGHCGYSVRPSERGKGYGTEMLRLMVANAGKLGIEKMLVVCDEDNVASEKTILANRGRLENIIEVDGCRMKRFWINTR